MEKLLIIAGTNASGKSGLGIELAEHFGAEIVSADSRQVFKGLDLGSGKVTAEEMRGVPHHMLDVAEPNEFFSLSHYQRMAYDAIDGILARGNKAFLVGGTGLYINAVADGYNLTESAPDPGLRSRVEAMTSDELISLIRSKSPAAVDRLDLQNKRRLERAAEKLLTAGELERPSEPRYETMILGVTWPREILYKRIEERLDRRLAEGMIGEVEQLIADGATDDFLYRLGLEYRYILMYIRGRFGSYGAFRDELFKQIRHLGKEQMTWFRKRKDIRWLNMEGDPFREAAQLIEEFYGM